jgi:hypothetical protein
MSAISKEKIKMCVLTKIQDIWTEWPDVSIKVTVVFMNILIEKKAGHQSEHQVY